MSNIKYTIKKNLKAQFKLTSIQLLTRFITEWISTFEWIFWASDSVTINFLQLFIATYWHSNVTATILYLKLCATLYSNYTLSQYFFDL